ncbi:helix-turn-helix domain-containing protein [Photorhabdus africana]|uniref:helix-turn-helix domain-containing protein n=1 Tax=Photorhabdus africana TaxID=3097554 RepID=UPI002B406E85|nr:helix-turn-helix domain-containing protein [Photorhabdus sp. CRI-LC]
MTLTRRKRVRQIFSEPAPVGLKWLENARIEKARTLLEEGRLPLKAIPGACGYRSSDVMRRAFVKNTGITPSVYRKIFIQTQQSGTNEEN